MKKILLATLALSIGAVAACSTSNAPNTGKVNTAAPANTSTVANAAPPKADDVPAAVKSVFANATITTQHKDLSDAQLATLEKDTGKKPEKDHHSYLAFTTSGGARTQIGAATLVKAAGKEIVVVYDNKDGSPVIKEVRAEGMPAGFLGQFAGKGHDDDLLLGTDIKAVGANEADAKAITDAIRADVLTMQALYGKAHAH